MDSRSSTADPRHPYQLPPWTRASLNTSAPAPTSPVLAEPALPTQLPSHIEFLPILLPDQSSLYQAQLLQYNKLVAPGRGGGGGLQGTPLPILSAFVSNSIQAAPRSRSSPRAVNKDLHTRLGAQNCHGHRASKTADKADAAVLTSGKEASPKMPAKKPAEAGHRPPSKSSGPASRAASNPPAQSSSVPSTPHQHARKFSFEDREPSPNAAQNHSPRSAYSETNSTLPSLRPLPPRLGGCKFEGALPSTRRRMPYSLGDERLERLAQDKIKSKLSEAEERKLETDMRELYDRLLPTQGIEQNRQRLVVKLRKLLNDEWPGHNIEVHLFGSSGNLLCSDDSDVDICITTDWKGLDPVCVIAELLAKHGMQNVKCVSSAKVPIVKIWDPELGLACDMNVNNTPALENTRMVRTYVEIDERVRPLAMIIKHWTRRRIVNDAAFGGTLSSYTWICMIIAFLQLQDPPVLPALHQQLHQRLPAKDGKKSAFADDLDKLRSFGGRNTDTLAVLLFKFFRFYAHEFDYDKSVLSVRLGKTIPKTEKKWHLALNNMLCVEEPFHTPRNLGNTADDTSFRGLHLELRRAFDLIAEAKLDECCEQFVYPKEEERIWQKPPPVPRPVLVRSSSQTHSGRGGGRGGFRGNNRQFHRNTNNSRRASSSVAFENNNAANLAQSAMLPPFMQQDAHGMWYPVQQPHLPQEVLGNALTALQLQEHSLRFQLFTQSQAYTQQAALAHAQRMQGSGPASSSDRSRTNSLDNPPLSAPIQQADVFLYGFPVQPAPYYAHPGFTTYPSSPATATNASEFRRSLHRGPVNGESGLPVGAASTRSQSQPASRTSMPLSQVQHPGLPSVPAADLATRRGKGAMPSFIADENMDAEVEESSAVAGPAGDSTPDDDEGRYIGYYVSESASPARQAQNPAPHTIPAFGDLTPVGDEGRRRLSTDQFPQTIVDGRRMRLSRSPSPAGHARAFSVGTSSAPLTSAPFPQAAAQPDPRNRPLVVNGSATKQGSSAGSSRQPSGNETVPMEDPGYDNPLHIHSGLPMMSAEWADRAPFEGPRSAGASVPGYDAPLIVNGSAALPSHIHPSFGSETARRGAAYMNGPAIVPLPAGMASGGAPVLSAKQLRAMSRQQLNGIAPLDLALGDYSSTADLRHLSPVYEARTPSPTVRRRLDMSGSSDSTVQADPASRDRRAGRPSSSSLASPSSGPRVASLPNRPNGNISSGRAEEAANPSGWQKPKGRKKANDSKPVNGFPHGEQMPKNDVDRKGG